MWDTLLACHKYFDRLEAYPTLRDAMCRANAPARPYPQDL
jgi:hypothetical protein